MNPVLLERLHASYVAGEAWPLMRTELVGRERELAALVEHLESALAAHPRVVLCRGEPGIGKTRMAEELTGLAATRSVPVAWGPAAESSGAPPYWPWRQVLRAVSASVDVVTIADKLGLTPDLVRLAPDVFDGPRAMTALCTDPRPPPPRHAGVPPATCHPSRKRRHLS